ncbi:MAG: ribosome small subunit-dependent GTPase A, partial [Prosthecobacter sp.]|nr:ribosome small subunit-dependent GTPase A [Prosthecobacter sp.]
ADEREVILGGKVYHDAETDADLPAVGDWVALESGGEEGEWVIRARLPRQSCFSRKAAGDSAEEQVLVANVGVVVVVTDAGTDFNLRRMERYFALIGRSGAKAVAILNKSDLYTDEQNQEAAAAIQALNPKADVHITSVRRRKNLKVLKNYLTRGVTVAFIGSSGVGKSAMINRILGDDWQWTDDVNEVTGKGRHTTSARELLILPKGGGIIVDNPGIKEVQMWTDETTLRERFADIEALAAQCQFHDCKHGTDQGCAIRAAVEKGELKPARLDSFFKLDEELLKLRGRRKTRQMTVERRAKRDHRVKARNRSDRSDIEQDLKPRAQRDG